MKKPNFKFNSIFSLITVFALIMVMASCGGRQSGQEQEAADETMADEQMEESGWIELFNGENLDGWKRYNADEIGPLWKVDGDAILVEGEGLGEGSGEWGGSLITIEQFGNFELELEWKISPGGNSGVLYHVVESPDYDHAYETGPEYQLLDDQGWEGNLTEAQKVGSNYDMFAAPADKNVKPAGEWNTSRIIYNDGHVEHWLNGGKTVEFDEGSDRYQEHYQNSKWVEFPDWNKFKTGSIGLQDHGAPVWFRNIRIRKL